MGYTHYWDTKPTISKNKWDLFTQAMKLLVKDANTIQKEYNDAKKPVINTREIRFNGIEEEGHETFYMKRVDKPKEWSENQDTVFGFCKTARKRYDPYVTASLLLAHMYLEDEITMDSDGDVDEWQAGVHLANQKVGEHLNFEISLQENPDAEYPASVRDALFVCKDLSLSKESIIPDEMMP